MNKAAVRWMVPILVVLACPAIHAEQVLTKGKVLVVVSSQKELTLKDGAKHRTGYFLNELGVPVKALVDAGFEPVFSDPAGNEPVMDTVSDKPSYFDMDETEYKAVKSFVESLPGLKHPQPLASVAAGDLNQYAGLFVPGGHAPMEDLWNQAALGKILRYFHQKNKPTALICHGPIALLSALEHPEALVVALEQGADVKKEAGWPFRGYHMTVYSTAAEKPNEKGFLGGLMKFYPEDALKAAGAEVSVVPPKGAHVVSDHELITGQNPYSDKELAATFLKALNSASK